MLKNTRYTILIVLFMVIHFHLLGQEVLQEKKLNPKKTDPQNNILQDYSKPYQRSVNRILSLMKEKYGTKEPNFVESAEIKDARQEKVEIPDFSEQVARQLKKERLKSYLKSNNRVVEKPSEKEITEKYENYSKNIDEDIFRYRVDLHDKVKKTTDQNTQKSDSILKANKILKEERIATLEESGKMRGLQQWQESFIPFNPEPVIIERPDIINETPTPEQQKIQTIESAEKDYPVSRESYEPAISFSFPVEENSSESLEYLEERKKKVLSRVTMNEMSSDNAPNIPADLNDSLVLVEIYQQMGGNTWTNRQNWLTGNVEDWFGINLNTNGRVSDIYLAFNNLVDSIPENIGNLSELQFLSLSDNKIIGPIPSSIGNSTQLISLELSFNKLSGNIPPELFTLNQLENLQLRNNSLSGEIDASIGNLISLIFLDLSENNFYGLLPIEIGNLTNLSDLHMSGNKFTGEIPVEFASLSSLRNFFLNNNVISGSFPDFLSSIPDLRFLDIGYNNFTGVLPSGIAQFDSLRFLRVGFNNFSGAIPPEIGQLSKIFELSLRGNDFTSIPPEIGNLSELEQLYLSSNEITSIPPEIGNLPNLRHLSLQDNQITNIPAEIGNLTTLYSLDLGANQISGSLPVAIGNLTNLDNLGLYSNNLTGALPVEIENLQNLRFLEASYNLLDRIDFDPVNMTNLTDMYLYDNQFQFDQLEPIYQTWTGNIFASGSVESNLPDTAISLGGGATLEANVAGANNNYQWYRNGSPIGNADTLFASQTGTYYAEVTNSVVTSRTFVTRDFQVWNGNFANAADSAALVDIYNSTTGAEWFNNDGWLTQPVALWYGITLSSAGYVTELNLGNNNLSGSLPVTVSDLDSVNNFNFTNNSISTISFDPLDLISSVFIDLAYNTMNYSELAKFDGISASFSLFSNQPFGKNIDTVIYTGQNITLSAGTTDGGYLYTWYKDGIPLFTDSLGAYEIQVDQPGQYYAEFDDQVVAPLVGYKLRSPNYFVNQLPKVNTQDSSALVAIYNALGGSNWADKSNWLVTSVNNWFGVSIDVDGRVSNLNLSNNNLVGILPPEIGDLDSLTYLEMGNNALQGELPPELFTLNRLSYLNLPSNVLSGTIPIDIQNLTNLFSINLSNNVLSGSIPIELTTLSSLSDLNLRTNQITGPIPAEISNLTNLNYLNISNNQLSGQIPGEIDSLQNLFGFYAYNNAFSGILPQDFGSNLTNLSDLDLSRNQLYGTLPQSLENTSLSYIYLEENEFDSIGFDPALMPNLNYLGLGRNNLDFIDLEPIILGSYTGDLIAFDQERIFPDTLITGTPADSIVLDATTPGTNNTYTWFRNGSIYASTPTLTLTESGNYYCEVTNSVVTPAISMILITGNVNAQLEIVPDSEDVNALVDLYNNTNGPNWINQSGWLGPDPLTWYGVTFDNNGKVIGLDLSNNNLEGTFPVEITQLDQLEELYLGNNSLSGTVPASISNLLNLRVLFAQFNQLEGTLPVEIGLLTSLEILDLSDNNFTGDLPSSFSDLSNLTQLFLSFNQFTGNLPANMGTLPLNNIAISFNQFSDISNLTGVTGYQLFAENNNLEFDDFEAIFSVEAPQSYIISPQNTPQTLLSGTQGGSLVLDASIGGSVNNYQWYKDGVLLNGEMDPQFIISTFDSDSTGLYSCEITNDNVTATYGLTIYRDFQVIEYLPVSASDSLTLVDIYNATDGPNWNQPEGWFELPVSAWDGVTVEGGRITGLNLSFRNLSGSVPISIGDLNGLEVLQLGSNNLSYVPGEIYSLSNLKVLDLEFNPLTNGISPAIDNLSALEELFIGGMGLEEIPDEIFGLTSLRSLDLRSNNISAQITTDLGNLVNLEYLIVNNNPISGQLPDVFSDLGSLQTVDFSNTNIEGPLPNSFYGLSGLRILNLSGTEILKGNIPTPFINFTSLEGLYIDENNFTNGLPDRLFELTTLRYFSCANCKLEGELDQQFSNLNNLEFVNLGNNKLTDISNLPGSNLTTLYVNNNDLSDIPSFSSYQSIQTFAIFDNFLSFDDLQELVDPYLSGNYSFLSFSQKPFTPDSTYIINSGDAISFSFPQDTSTVNYQWSGPNGLVQNTRTLTVSSAQNPENDGFYSGEATNSFVTGNLNVTLRSGDITIQVEDPVVADDSIVLVDLYNSLNGAEWNSNWLQGPVESWDGITAHGGYVRVINLPFFVTGSIPASLGQLDSLETLFIRS